MVLDISEFRIEKDENNKKREGTGRSLFIKLTGRIRGKRPKNGFQRGSSGNICRILRNERLKIPYKHVVLIIVAVRTGFYLYYFLSQNSRYDQARTLHNGGF